MCVAVALSRSSRGVLHNFLGTDGRWHHVGLQHLFFLVFPTAVHIEPSHFHKTKEHTRNTHSSHCRTRVGGDEGVRVGGDEGVGSYHQAPGTGVVSVQVRTQSKNSAAHEVCVWVREREREREGGRERESRVRATRRRMA